MEPRLSILVPNFNNGQASSCGGRDLIGALFESLAATLADDPTPLEIIVADDGSTDESLATCRRWAQMRWGACGGVGGAGGGRGDQPFCRLIERPHCGVLSVVANRLTAVARGELCCRLDGDVVMLTPRWAEHLCAVFDEAGPAVGIVGAKQLTPQGRVHTAGDWVLHPRGYHHHGRGADRRAVGRAIEVDHVMGAFYAHRRAVWQRLGGYDERLGRGQTVDFGLRARLAGVRTISIPTIEIVHHHTARGRRDSRADSDAGLAESLTRFRCKWGFDRLAPDLDEVRRRYARTPLLWNVEVFGPAASWPPPAPGPIDPAASTWARFAGDERYRRGVLWRTGLVERLLPRLRPRPRIGQAFSRDGLIGHLLARHGVRYVGADPDSGRVELARAVSARERYPGPPPEFLEAADAARLPLGGGGLDALLLLDVVHRHPNPAGLFAEAARVLAPGGVVLVVAALRQGPFDDGRPGRRAWRPDELRRQLRAAAGFEAVPLAADSRGTGCFAVLARSPGQGAAAGPGVDVRSAACRTMLANRSRAVAGA